MTGHLLNTPESRMLFVETTAALGLAAGLLPSSGWAEDETIHSARTLPGRKDDLICVCTRSRQPNDSIGKRISTNYSTCRRLR